MSAVPRKIRQKVARLSKQFGKQTVKMSFTVKKNPNYQALVLMGPKAIPALIEDLRKTGLHGHHWRIEAILDILNKYLRIDIEDYADSESCFKAICSMANDFDLYNYKQKSKHKVDPYRAVHHSKESNVSYVITNIK